MPEAQIVSFLGLNTNKKIARCFIKVTNTDSLEAGLYTMQSKEKTIEHAKVSETHMIPGHFQVEMSMDAQPEQNEIYTLVKESI